MGGMHAGLIVSVLLLPTLVILNPVNIIYSKVEAVLFYHDINESKNHDWL